MDNYWLLTIVLAIIFIVGTGLCLPLYEWNVRRLVASQLFIKCMMWVPIYVLFSIVVFGPPLVGVVALSVILVLALREFSLNTRRRVTSQALAYIVFFSIATVTLIALILLFPRDFPLLILAAGVSSAMSDVFAFFAGKFLGRHHLPTWINEGKSWEGVAGQIVGGAVGMAIISLSYDHSLDLFFGVIVGASSAVGDIVNSVAKRSLTIKDWGNSIPGHGGYLDRFSSLMTAYFVVSILFFLRIYIN